MHTAFLIAHPLLLLRTPSSLSSTATSCVGRTHPGRQQLHQTSQWYSTRVQKLAPPTVDGRPAVAQSAHPIHTARCTCRRLGGAEQCAATICGRVCTYREPGVAHVRRPDSHRCLHFAAARFTLPSAAHARPGCALALPCFRHTCVALGLLLTSGVVRKSVAHYAAHAQCRVTLFIDRWSAPTAPATGACARHRPAAGRAARQPQHVTADSERGAGGVAQSKRLHPRRSHLYAAALCWRPWRLLQHSHSNTNHALTYWQPLRTSRRCNCVATSTAGDRTVSRSSARSRYASSGVVVSVSS